MKASFDEIRRMSYRALQTSGVPNGIEEDAAWACAYLQAAGRPGLEMLADALDACNGKAPDASLEVSGGIADCGGRSAIFFAANAVEFVAASRGTLELRKITHADYLLPFAVRASDAGNPVAVSLPGEALHSVTIAAGDCDHLQLHEQVETAIVNGIAVSANDFARVKTYAARILVSETEVSRLTGAGAGLTDND